MPKCQNVPRQIMNDQNKYCPNCEMEIQAKVIGRNLYCPKCGKLIGGLPTDSATADPCRPVGFGTEVFRTPRRGLGWGR